VKRDDLKLPAAEAGAPVAVQAIGEVEAVAFDPGLLAGEVGPAGAASPGYAAETRAAVVVFKAETEMAVVEGARRRGETGMAGEKKRVGVAEAEGCELLEGGEEAGSDVGESQLDVAG